MGTLLFNDPYYILVRSPLNFVQTALRCLNNSLVPYNAPSRINVRICGFSSDFRSIDLIHLKQVISQWKQIKENFTFTRNISYSFDSFVILT